METFTEFLTSRNEGFFDGAFGRGRSQTVSQPTIPSSLAYHIADAINGAMIQFGRMPSPQPHRPFGDAPGDSSYDPSTKFRLRNMLYDKAKQMLASGDTKGLLSYFGYDAQNGKPVSPGSFTKDIQSSLKGAV